MKKFLKKTVAVASVALATIFVVGTPALASAPPPVNADTVDTSTFTLAAPIVTLLVSLIIPVINGIFSKPSTPGWVKGFGTIVLNSAMALLTNGLLGDGSAAWSTTTLYTAIIGCLISGFAYANIYKPAGITSSPVDTASGMKEPGKLANVGRHD